MKIFVIGSSITSAYWNGAATYYRGIYRSLAQLGHEIVFAEPDAYGRQAKRDGTDADFHYVQSWVYQSPQEIPALMQAARRADLVIKHSGVGVDDALLESAVCELSSPQTQVAFWDVDAPATLERVEADAHDAFRPLIPRYDFIFTYGGGPPVVEHYTRLGARNCYPIYNAHDPDTHFPVPAEERFACDLAFVGNRLPDREQRVQDFFFAVADAAPHLSFLLGGEGWSSKTLPRNVRWLGHVATGDHNAINSSARMVLNINRSSMADVGFSPPTRVFEAAGAGACVITDAWPGIDQFFVPDAEILIANTGADIVAALENISPLRAAGIGEAMRSRALREHTYAMRAREVDRILAAARLQLTAA